MSTHEIIGFVDAILLIGLIGVWTASLFSEKLEPLGRKLAIGFACLLVVQVLVFK